MLLLDVLASALKYERIYYVTWLTAAAAAAAEHAHVPCVRSGLPPCTEHDQWWSLSWCV